MIQELNDKNFDSMDTKGIAIVDFYSETCGPCKNVMKLLESIEEELTKHKPLVRIFKVDVYQSQQLAMSYGVRQVPTVFIWKDNKVIEQFIGI